MTKQRATAALPVLLGLVAACASRSAPPPASPAPLPVEISSLTTDFATAISLRGMATFQNDSIVVTADSVLLRARTTEGGQTHRSFLDSIRLGLAEPGTDGGWKVAFWGPAVPVGRDVSTTVEFSLPRVRLAVPVGSTGRLPRRWLVVEMPHSVSPSQPYGNRATTYAHSARDLFTGVGAGQPDRGADPPAPARFGDWVDQAPVFIRARVACPRAARDAGLDGWVRFSLVVGVDGRLEPESIRLLGYSDVMFVDPAQNAILTAEFRPGRLRGVAVRVGVLQPIHFRCAGR